MKKRLLSLALALVMVLGMVPAVSHPAEAAKDLANVTTPDEENGNDEPFGIPTPGLSDGTPEHDQLKAQDPFAKPDRPFVLDERSELYMTGGGAGQQYETRVYDWNSGGNFEEDFTKENSGKDIYNTTSGMEGFQVTASMMSGEGNGGKKDYVAQLGATNNQLTLNIINPKTGSTVTTDSINVKQYGDSYIDNHVTIVCGDFDGNGVDSAVFMAVPNNGAPNKNNNRYNHAYLVEAIYDKDTNKVTIDTRFADLNSVFGEDIYIPMISLSAADVDRDGYDELVAVVSKAGESKVDRGWGSRVLIYDKLDGVWTLTQKIEQLHADMDDSGNTVYNRNMAYGGVSVGNLILSTGSVDYPEILITGSQSVEDSDEVYVETNASYSVLSCSGPKTNEHGNIQGIYQEVSTGEIPLTDLDGAIKDLGSSQLSTAYSWRRVNQNLCFNANGTGDGQETPDVFFWNGGIYQLSTEDGNTIQELYRDNKNALSVYDFPRNYDYMHIGRITAGNFIGTDDMRQQVIFALHHHFTGAYHRFALWDDPAENSLSLIAFYIDDDGKWQTRDMSNYFETGFRNDKPSYFSITACDYDDDSIVVKLTRLERVWSQPTVIGILECVPYFEELWYDLGESITTLATSTSTGSSTDRHNCVTGNTVIGFEHTVEIIEGMPGFGGFELTYNRTRTWDHTTENTISKTFSYGNNTNETQVIMSRMPTVEYIYKDVKTGAEFMVGVTSSATTSMISLDEYNEAAKKFGGMDQIDESKLCTPGDPSSYPMNPTQIQAMGGTDIMVAADGQSGSWGRYNSEGDIEMTIGSEEVKSDEYDVDNVTEFTAYAITFGFKFGGGAGGGKGTTTGTIHGNAIERTGAVQGPGVDGYDFEWNFVTYNMPLNGQKAPVLGYLVRNIVSHPSPPAGNIQINDVGKDYVQLAWNPGTRPADQYIIYMVNENNTVAKYIEMGRCSGDSEHFTITGLKPLTTYTFVVRGSSRLSGESYDSERAIATTTNGDGSKYVTINGLTNNTSKVDTQGTISTVVTQSPDMGIVQTMYQWQRRQAGDVLWEDVSGQTTQKLTIPNMTQDMDGDEYRLMVVVVTNDGQEAIYYSDTATVDIAITETQVTDFKINNAEGGEGSAENPYYGAAAYTTTEKQTTTGQMETQATFEKGDAIGYVNEIPDKNIFIGKLGGQYYKLNKEDGDTYTLASGEETAAIESKTLYKTVTTGEDGSVQYKDYAGAAEGFATPKQETGTISGTEETFDAYILWDGKNANGLSENNIHWRLIKNGAIKWYTKDGESFTEEGKPEQGEERRLFQVYKLAAGDEDTTTILSDGSAYYVITSELFNVEKVVAYNQYEVDGETFFDEDLKAVTVSKETSTTTDKLVKEKGRIITVSATLKDKNGKTLPKGTKAHVLVKNEGTGVVASYDVEANDSGQVTLDWAAQNAGSYTFQVEIPEQGVYSSSVTESTLYYTAGETTDGNVSNIYRLTAKANGAAIADTIGMGQIVTLDLQLKTAKEESWKDVFSSGNEKELNGNLKELLDKRIPLLTEKNIPDGLSVVITSPSGKQTTIKWRDTKDKNSFTFKAEELGSYLVQWYLTTSTVRFSLVRRLDSTNTLRAGTTVVVAPQSITVEPQWTGYKEGTPTERENVTMKVVEGSLIAEDQVQLEKALEVKSNYFDLTEQNKDNHGTFEVRLDWADVEKDSSGGDVVTAQNRILGAYTVTLKNGYIRNPYRKVHVEFTTDSGGSVYAYQEDRPISESPAQIEELTRLSFQAVPVEGYQVQGWEINGELYNAETMPGWTETEVSGTANRYLILDELRIGQNTTGSEEGDDFTLTVKPLFTNRSVSVTYSVEGGSGGGITAATTQGGNSLESGNNITAGAGVVFTASPAQGQMIEEWTVKYGSGEEKDYTIESGETYREKTLTLERITDDVEVKVYFQPMAQTKVTFSMVTDVSTEDGISQWDQPFEGGTITASYGEGSNLASGGTVVQGTPVTFEVSINDPAQNIVHAWQYKTDDDEDWVTVSESLGKTSFTFENPKTDELQVRVQIDRAQTYSLTWKIVGKDGMEVPAGTSLRVTSNGTELQQTQHTANISVDFELTLNKDYYVVSWQGASADGDYSKKARIGELTGDTEVTVTVAEKPKLTLPGSFEHGTLKVAGIFNGVSENWTLPGANSDLHYDPGMDITVTVTPDMGYVPQKDGADLVLPEKTDVYTETYKGSNIGNGLDLSKYGVRALDKIDVHFFIISEGGWKGPDAGGSAHGTLEATVGRKDIAAYSATEKDEGDATDNIDAYVLTLYEGGTVTLTAEGDPGTGTETSSKHNVDFWSVDKENNFKEQYRNGKIEVISNVLNIKYEQIVEAGIAADDKFYIGVSFAQAGTRVSFGMAAGQEDLGTVSAALDSGLQLENLDFIGDNAKVTFTASGIDSHYEIKHWILNRTEQTEATGATFEYTADGRNMEVFLELQGKKLSGFAVNAGANGSAKLTYSGDAVRYKESVTLTATPDPGYEFDGWYVGSSRIKDAGEVYTFQPTEGKTYTAKFKPKEGLSVTFVVDDPEGGTITATADGRTFSSGAATLKGGQKIVLTLKLTDGWRLVKDKRWTGLPEGASLSADGLTATVTKLAASIDSIVANVEKIPECTVTVVQPETSITVTATVNGKPMTEDTFTVRDGTEVTFTYSYKEGPSILFGNWVVNGEQQSNDKTLTVTVDSDITVAVNTNVGLMHTLTLESTTDIESGLSTMAMENDISAHVGQVDYENGTHRLPSGSTVAVRAIPGEEQMIYAWYIDGEPQMTETGRLNLELTLPEFNLDNDTLVKVVFEKKEEYPYPTSEENIFTVDKVTSYPTGENSGVAEGNYRKGGDLSFTIKSTSEESGAELLPYIDGFFACGEKVNVIKNADGSWTVEVQGVTGKIELPRMRLKMQEGIPDESIKNLKTDDVYNNLKKYLPDTVKSGADITGQVITDVMKKLVITKMPGASSSSTAVYDVTLQEYVGGVWKDITDVEEFPEDGITVTLPYPKGTTRSYKFTVAHMFTVESKDKLHQPGDVEYPEVTNTGSGIQFKVTSLSPIAVAWEAPTYSVNTSHSGSGTVSASPTRAKEGTTITVTVTPAEGYKVNSVTVKRSNGGGVTVSGSGSRYTFTMPADNVTVSVSFIPTGGTPGGDKPDKPDKPDQPGGGGTTGGGGGSAGPAKDMYSVVLPADVPNGVVSASKWTAAPGDTVTLTVRPDRCYGLEALTVRDASGRSLALRYNADGTYSFTMPESGVTVAVSFRFSCDGGALCPSRQFADVETGSWYHEYTDYVINHELMHGTGEGLFEPGGTVVRAQMVTVLWNMRGRPTVDYDMDYTDVAADAWYAQAVRWASGTGIAGGYGDGTFGPDDLITREQMAAMLYRYEQRYGDGGFTGPWAYAMPFADAASISDWAYEAVAWCSMRGIMSGKDDNLFDPAGAARRCEMAAILTRYCTR